MRAIRISRMEKMDIRLISVVEHEEQVRARLNARAPERNIRLWLEINFKTRANSDRTDWMHEAYDRALSVLDPA